MPGMSSLTVVIGEDASTNCNIYAKNGNNSSSDSDSDWSLSWDMKLQNISF